MSDSWPWRGRVDRAEGPDALRWHQVVQPAAAATAPGIALLGFACDEGVRRNFGRPGAEEGPAALRRALGNLAWHGGPPLLDAGDVTCAGGDLEGAQERLAAEVAALLRAGHRPIVLGGGHETAWGSFLGLATARPDSRIDETDGPNGAINGIAGIYSEKFNVLGMMPHPENYIEPEIGPTDGRGLFESLAGALKAA